MRPALALAIALSLSGCGTVFDPAPYSPTTDKAVISSGEGSNAIDMLQFKTPEQAAVKLQALAQGYAGERDDILRQQLIFDVPMIGLGAATIINPIFRGATDTTIALGLGAAGAAGLRTYFAPQTKAMAYNSAATSLSCASGVASAMAPEYDGSHGETARYVEANAKLGDSVSRASGLILAGQIPDKTLAAALLVARDQGQKALGDLASAIDVADTSPVHLQIFANAVINGTNKKIISGEQNVDAVLAALKTAPTSVTSTTVAAPPQASSAPRAPALPGEKPLTPAERATADATALIPTLQAEAGEAEAAANRINAIWAMLPACAATS